MDLRPLARPLISAMFVAGGLDSLERPGPKVDTADEVATTIAETVGLPTDTELLVRINGGVQVGAGLLMALGRLPRLSALALLASLGPTTLAGHPFWEMEDPGQRKAHRLHFLKNLGLAGGLLATMSTASGSSDAD